MKTYLEERIEWYEDNYRNGNALISDKQFDQLEKNLLRINPNCDYFRRKNKLVLPSLEKGSVDEFLKGLLADTRLLIEPKIDGCAVALQYINGNLEKAISRKGSNVTSKLIKFQNIPNKLSLRGVLQVRGELYAPNQSPHISQRIASRFLRAKEGFSESLSFCAFQIINSKLNQYESKKCLSKLGFTIPEDISCNFTSQVKVFRKQWLEGKLFRKYPTDGIVVKINSRKLQLIREKSNLDYPYWQMAIKS
ncbi:NAD-dependent DNA ligase [Prochlorococcus marinus str. MU1404]|uniref:NAD-dependent DNA ligase n=1 Tax=Prochlorococcus marinus TaxID=1219 RepID=UPI001ADCFC29|nr:NAD-dependent DNA ligase [Prochlorococcus marinus]MBO8229916.1 NAD-dependent DNA ligase [Prochlorococcus marinus XMU1404]MBW3073302.1 NAD-dependent DNA ligase [Prochlorococcus marinus str. MU1404]MCR8545748.1 NAD-dependent DNA ligase [Prochlorococcus marinus CUG1432]